VGIAIGLTCFLAGYLLGWSCQSRAHHQRCVHCSRLMETLGRRVGILTQKCEALCLSSLGSQTPEAGPRLGILDED
jgi:hypothetical protein